MKITKSRKVATKRAVKYRYLKAGDKIKLGDQWKCNGKWIPRQFVSPREFYEPLVNGSVYHLPHRRLVKGATK